MNSLIPEMYLQKELPSHYCTECGALWKHQPSSATALKTEFFQLWSTSCGTCCDNPYPNLENSTLKLLSVLDFLQRIKAEPQRIKVAPCSIGNPHQQINPLVEKYPYYYKDIRHLDSLDVYRVIDLYGVKHPCLQHAVKKLLVPGGRGAGKEFERDVKEAHDSLSRALAMFEEDKAAK